VQHLVSGITWLKLSRAVFQGCTSQPPPPFRGVRVVFGFLSANFILHATFYFCQERQLSPVEATISPEMMTICIHPTHSSQNVAVGSSWPALVKKGSSGGLSQRQLSPINIRSSFTIQKASVHFRRLSTTSYTLS
jgi:hypothetical protein